MVTSDSESCLQLPQWKQPDLYHLPNRVAVSTAIDKLPAAIPAQAKHIFMDTSSAGARPRAPHTGCASASCGNDQFFNAIPQLPVS